MVERKGEHGFDCQHQGLRIQDECGISLENGQYLLRGRDN